MKVICYDNRGANLTVGNEYVVQGESEDCYIIRNDKDIMSEYLKSRFIAEDVNSEKKCSCGTTCVTTSTTNTTIFKNTINTDGVIKKINIEEYCDIKYSFLNVIFNYAWEINHTDEIVKFEIADGQVVARNIETGRIYDFGEMETMEISDYGEYGLTIIGDRTTDEDGELEWYLSWIVED